MILHILNPCMINSNGAWCNVKGRIANASRSSGILMKAVFQNKDLNPKTKVKVYSEVVVSTLIIIMVQKPNSR